MKPGATALTLMFLPASSLVAVFDKASEESTRYSVRSKQSCSERVNSLTQDFIFVLPLCLLHCDVTDEVIGT